VSNVTAETTVANRLGSTLFLAVLAHGVIILGVTFGSDSDPSEASAESIKVTMLIDTEYLPDEPEDSEYIANRNELGIGSAEGPRPMTTVSAEQHLSVQGDTRGKDLQDRVLQELALPTEQLVTRHNDDRAIRATPQSAEAVSDVPSRAAALLHVTTPQTRAREINETAALAAHTDDASPVSPSARASILAAYLDDWRRRVERIGTLNFPRQYVDDTRALSQPTLRVLIAADGELEDVVIQESSGSPELDRAALGILRMAAPFEALPDAIRDESGSLLFAYQWDFVKGLSVP
jgi:protein TonB